MPFMKKSTLAVFGFAPAEPPSTLSPAARAKGAQLALGRASKAYDTKAAELTAARSQLAHLDQTIGEKGADGLDVTLDLHERQRLQSLVQQLELAVSILRQRQEDAATSLKEAELSMAVDAEANALSQNKAVGLRVDDAFEALHQLAQEQAETWDAVRLAGGNETYASRHTDARLQFQLFLNLAAHPFTGVGHVPQRLMKWARFSECAPDPATAGTRRRA